MQTSALSASAPAHGVFRQARHPAGGRRWSALQRAASALPCAHSCMPRTATPPNGSSQAPGASARLAAHSSACTCHLLGQPAATVLPAWAGGRAQAEEEAGRAPVTHSSSWRPSPVSPSARARNCRTRSSARCTTDARPAASSSRSPWPPRRQAAGRASDAPTMQKLAFASLGRAAAVRTLPSSAGRRRESGVQHDAHPCTQRHCPRQRAGPHCQPHPRIRSQNGHALGAGFSPGATQTRSARASQLDAAQRRGPHRLCRAGCDQGRLLLGRQALPDRFCGVQLTRGPHARVHQPARARRHGLACRGARRSGRRAPRRYQYRRPI